ncbi:hypothetical protein DSO57_1004406 [Entomophthora muscae]|uniref:Uncharacterized protein n=1 Tax=Entomophthora muscae TaxID=34485 RepID=A0ACC2SXA8_9FUNG|nr:hypothetical protein DSO57_1004406 [Entomophthora muscae]
MKQGAIKGVQSETFKGLITMTGSSGITRPLKLYRELETNKKVQGPKIKELGLKKKEPKLSKEQESRTKEQEFKTKEKKFKTKVKEPKTNYKESKRFLEDSNYCVANDISILVSKTQELKPSLQEMPCVNQGRQEPARLPVGTNPGPLEMPCPNQEGQEPVSLLSIENESSISTLETPESNPDPSNEN